MQHPPPRHPRALRAVLALFVTLLVGAVALATTSCGDDSSKPADAYVEGPGGDITVDSGSPDVSSACGPSNCTGCCLGGQCLGGVTLATCGKGGITCGQCAPPKHCTTGVCQ